MNKYKAILIGIAAFIIGLFLCKIGSQGSGDEYLNRLDMINTSILYTSSIVTMLGYLLLKKNDK